MMVDLSGNQRYLLKLVAYLVIYVFFEAIPHELGHFVVGTLLGFQVTGVHWAPFDSSFVSFNTVYNPVLFKLVLVAGGWSVCLCSLIIYRLSHDRALRVISRIFILYGFFGGLFEALFTHIYNMVQFFSYTILVLCTVAVFAYDDLSKHFQSSVSARADR